jgi:HD-like signal output (HDOD) protein
MTMISAQALAASVSELPALPAVVLELMEAMGHDDFNAEQLSQKLSHDQALTAKTLRLANSSFYGVPRKVVSIQEAISILGMRTVRSVVMAAGLVGGFKHEQCPAFDFNAFWRHSIGTGLCAKAIATHVGLDGDMAFMVGLLHDIGHLALAVFCGPLIPVVQAHQDQHDCSLSEAEKAILGTDHAFVGKCVTERWRFAPMIVEAVATYHAPAELKMPNMVSVVHVADSMAHALDLSGTENDMVLPLNLVVWASLKLRDDECLSIFREVETQLDDLCRALLSPST